MPNKRPSSTWPLLLAALAFAVIAVFYWRGLKQPLNDDLHTLELPSAPAPIAPPRSGLDTPSAPPAAGNPVEESAAGQALTADVPAAAGTEATPSTPPIEQALADLLGAPAFAALVVNDDLVNRIVVAVDNLPNEKLPVRLWPVRALGSLPKVREETDGLVLTADNAARYGEYVALLERLDMRQLAALYVREYPRFQAAYRALGYPEGYFNDRLLDVIDHLLVTPELTAAPRLVQPKVMYQFADADLEARSLGQKVLLRIGPANAAIVKARLRELRRLVMRRDAPAKG